MKSSIQTLFLIFLVFQLGACATTRKTDDDHYKKMRNGVVYITYQKASIAAMKPIVKKYNKSLAKDNKPQSGATHIHALLSLIWTAVSEPKYALAESEYAVRASTEPADKYAALVIQSLTMHKIGWHHLAKKQSIAAKALVTAHGFSNRYDNTLIMVHVVGSALALQEGNIPYVASEVSDLGVATGQDWLVELGSATEDVYNGASSKAISKLDELKNNPNLSENERKGVAKAAKAARAGGKDVGKEVAKAVVSVALEVGIKKSSLTPIVLQELPKKYQKKLAKYL